MMRVQDIPYMNLTDRDCKLAIHVKSCPTVLLARCYYLQFISYTYSVDPARDHVFYMTVPAEWKTSDIFQLFSVYGKWVQFVWLNVTNV